MKIRMNRQVSIPKKIFEALSLAEGDFIEVSQKRGVIAMRPKKLLDAEDVLTPDEEASVARGLAQIRRGKYVTLKRLKYDLAL